MMLKTVIYSIDWLLPWLTTTMLAAHSVLLQVSHYPFSYEYLALKQYCTEMLGKER